SPTRRRRRHDRRRLQAVTREVYEPRGRGWCVATQVIGRLNHHSDRAGSAGPWLVGPVFLAL
ncbi:MAG TPA: hypothetical protein VNC63_01890, partial [Propionibacteriaceae bacterium]|nr:hypothetical protein [Propionibacteriaceae bacterium]